MFYFFMSQYLFCKKSNRELEFNDTGFFSFVSKKELKHGYRGGGGHVFFAKLYLIFILYLFYIFIQKNPIFLYNFCQKWLDSLYKRYINDFSAHKTSLTMLSFYT